MNFRRFSSALIVALPTVLAGLAVPAGLPARGASRATGPVAVRFGRDQAITTDTSFSGGVDPREVSIAASPTDARSLVAGFKDYYPKANDRICRAAFTSDGGRTWSPGPVMPLRPAPPQSFSGCTNASVGADLSGNFYYAYLDGLITTAAYFDVRVARSSDGGRTFPDAPVAVHGDAVTVDPDKPYVAVDAWPASPFSGRIYVSYTDVAAGYQIRLVASRDRGATWSAPVPLSRSASFDSSDVIQGSVPVVAPDGTVYVFWAEFDHIFGHLAIRFAKSSDGGEGWSRPADVAASLPSPGGFGLRDSGSDGTTPADRFVSASFPTAASGPDGTLFVAWPDFPNGSCVPGPYEPVCSNADVRVSVSRDGGGRWSAPVSAADDRSGADQFLPWMAAHPDGLVSLVWLDRRLDPDGLDYDLFYTNTADGRKFLPNVRVSGASSIVTRSSTSMGVGDYIGIAATGGAVFPAWADLRDLNNLEVYTATGQLSR